MESSNQPAPASKAILWTGWVLTVLPAALFLFSGGAKIVQPPGFEEGFKKIEWHASLAFGLGIVEVACALIYLLPPTAVLGAILLTGYLGGAIATHVRIGEPFIPHIIIGIVVWGGIYLRDARLRALLPVRR